MSAKTGLAPTRRIALAVETKVKEGHTTSSSRPTPRARSASSRAWVQEVVRSTRCAPSRSASRASTRRPNGPSPPTLPASASVIRSTSASSNQGAQKATGAGRSSGRDADAMVAISSPYSPGESIEHEPRSHDLTRTERPTRDRLDRSLVLVADPVALRGRPLRGAPALLSRPFEPVRSRLRVPAPLPPGRGVAALVPVCRRRRAVRLRLSGRAVARGARRESMGARGGTAAASLPRDARLRAARPGPRGPLCGGVAGGSGLRAGRLPSVVREPAAAPPRPRLGALGPPRLPSLARGAVAQEVRRAWPRGRAPAQHPLW